MFQKLITSILLINSIFLGIIHVDYIIEYGDSILLEETKTPKWEFPKFLGDGYEPENPKTIKSEDAAKIFPVDLEIKSLSQKEYQDVGNKGDYHYYLFKATLANDENITKPFFLVKKSYLNKDDFEDPVSFELFRQYSLYSRRRMVIV